MNLSGQQRKQLREAFIDAFRDKSSLEQMLSDQLDKNLDAIAEGGSLETVVFNLMKVADSQGWLFDLVCKAYEYNSGNLRLKAIAEELMTNRAITATPSVSSHNKLLVQQDIEIVDVYIIDKPDEIENFWLTCLKTPIWKNWFKNSKKQGIELSSFPLIDIKLRNISTQSAFLKEITVNATRVQARMWNIAPSMFPPTCAYHILLGKNWHDNEEDNAVKISQLVKPNDIDRFVVIVGSQEHLKYAEYTIKLTLHYNKDSCIHLGDFVVKMHFPYFFYPKKLDYIISNATELPTDNPTPNINTFQFEVVTVNASGQEVKRDINKAQYFTEDLGNGISLQMVTIPGGQFTIGTKDEEIERLVKQFNNNDFTRERSQHQVTVKPFFMGKYSVTQAQWKRVAALPKVKLNLSADPSYFKGDNRPVENVSWNEAVEFCDRLSKYTNRQYRLPSEAEWEYACRAGTTTPFHFGERIKPELANYKGGFTYDKKTIDVGSFSPNSFGLYDMHGNVWEWCQDTWHESHEERPSDGSSWINNDEELHLLRGGSWYTEPDMCRSAYRKANFGSPYDQYVGFRVVCDAARTVYPLTL